MPDYRRIADALAAEIAGGRLKPGERLPPQRDFAYQRGIAVSTASRVYAELTRRGLITGEVGRGTYVRPALEAPGAALVEPPTAAANLELNFPILPEQGALLFDALSRLLRPQTMSQALRPVGAGGTPEARSIASRFLSRAEWVPDPANILFTAGGRQAIASAIATLVPPGERLGVEALTYPAVKSIAARLGVSLVPIAMDREGVHPDAVFEAHRSAPLRALYLQPTLHNPLGATMGHERRSEIADLLSRSDLYAIEDTVYAFLADEQPLAAFAPERVVLIDSLSKRVAPGLTLGMAACPPSLASRVAAGIRSGAWTASGFPLAVGLEWMSNGTVSKLADAKRSDAAQRHQIAVELLSGLTVVSDARAYHLWVELPEHWRAENFAAAAGRQGIAVTPGSAFATTPGHAPNAVRLAVASPPLDVLAEALRMLRVLAEAESAHEVE